MLKDVNRRSCFLPAGQTRRNWEVLFLIFLFFFALGIRLLFLVEVADLPLFDLNALKGMDMAKYMIWGFSISSGDWLGSEAYWQAPLFPYMLGVVFKLFGKNIYIACLIQVILSAFTCILIYLIARETFSRKVACVSSLISCFYGPFIFYCPVLLSETLGIFLISIALFSFVHSLKRPRKGVFLISGMLLGFASLARANFLIFVPFVLVILFSRRRSLKVVSLFLAFCAGLAIIILPVTARNYIVSGRVVIISANTFENFRLANSYDSVALNFGYPRLPMMPVLSQVFWKHQLKKAVLFWWGFEVPQNVNYYLWMKYSRILRLPILPFWLIAPLSLTGIIVSLVNRRGNLSLYLFSLSYYASVVPFFIISRFRLPIMVGLIPFAGLCLCSFHEQLKLKVYKRFLLHFIPFMALMLLMIPWQAERIRANDYKMLGLAMFRNGMHTDAVKQLRKYLKLKPEADDYDTIDGIIRMLENHRLTH